MIPPHPGAGGRRGAVSGTDRKSLAGHPPLLDCPSPGVRRHLGALHAAYGHGQRAHDHRQEQGEGLRGAGHRRDLRRVAGIDEARAELVEIVDFLKRPEHYRRLGGKIPKGVLLVGAPGTGKTLLAKAVAGEAGVPFFSLSGPTSSRCLWASARPACATSSRRRRRGHQASSSSTSWMPWESARHQSLMGGHDEREQTLNSSWRRWTASTRKASSSWPPPTGQKILDPALLRPGRFDRQVVIDRPDLKGRAKILRVHTRQVTLAPAVELEQIAARTPGFVGADLANLVNEAALRAAREGKDAVEMVDFEKPSTR